jgi:hypothetical protein
MAAELAPAIELAAAAHNNVNDLDGKPLVLIVPT